MGNNWLPWVIMLGGAAVVYFVIIKPLSNPDIRKFVGSAMTGDKQVMNKTLQEMYRKYPEAQAQLRAKDPEAYRKVMAGNALYSNSYYTDMPRLAI
jgi:hypothetical protein